MGAEALVPPHLDDRRCAAGRWCGSLGPLASGARLAPRDRGATRGRRGRKNRKCSTMRRSWTHPRTWRPRMHAVVLRRLTNATTRHVPAHPMALQPPLTQLRLALKTRLRHPQAVKKTGIGTNKKLIRTPYYPVSLKLFRVRTQCFSVESCTRALWTERRFASDGLHVSPASRAAAAPSIRRRGASCCAHACPGPLLCMPCPRLDAWAAREDPASQGSIAGRREGKEASFSQAVDNAETCKLCVRIVCDSPSLFFVVARVGGECSDTSLSALPLVRSSVSFQLCVRCESHTLRCMHWSTHANLFVHSSHLLSTVEARLPRLTAW